MSAPRSASLCACYEMPGADILDTDSRIACDQAGCLTSILKLSLERATPRATPKVKHAHTLEAAAPTEHASTAAPRKPAAVLLKETSQVRLPPYLVDSTQLELPSCVHDSVMHNATCHTDLGGGGTRHSGGTSSSRMRARTATECSRPSTAGRLLKPDKAGTGRGGEARFCFGSKTRS
eukprot:3927798-Rhodomonas_salina.1